MTIVPSSAPELGQTAARKTEGVVARLKSALIRRKWAIIQHSFLSLLFVLIFLALNLPQTIFISQLGSSAWYPANGLVLALMLGVSPWYALLVAVSNVLAGALIYHAPLVSFGETFGAIALAGWYGLAAYILRGVLRIDLRLYRGRDVVRYVLIATAAALGSTVTGVACLLADHTIVLHDFWPTVYNWFIGDEIGLVGLAPFLLIHVFPWVRKRVSPRSTESDLRTANPRPIPVEVTLGSVTEALGQALTVFAVLWIMFEPRWAHLELLYLSFVPILWMAMRRGVRQVATGILALNFGIIVAMHLLPPPPALLAKIGLLMLVVSATGLIVGSTVTERQQTGIDLHERTTYLDSLIENSPFGIVVLDQSGRVELVNAAFTKLFLYEQSELVGSNLDSLLMLSDSSEEKAIPWSAPVIAGKALQRTVRTQRKDGEILDLDLQAVPLVVDGRIRGAYTICRDISEQVRASVAERDHADALNRLVKELELQTAQMTLLNEMVGLLECCRTSAEAFSVVDRSARALFPEATCGTLYMFRASRNLVELAASWGNTTGLQPVFGPEACWALRRGQAHWSDNAGGPVCTHLSDAPAAKHLCVPMVGQGETLGILHLEFACDKEEPLSQRGAQQRLAATVAGQIALSIASLKLREKLHDQSIRDPLTGLFNRRFMEESFDRELVRAKRKGHPLSVLFLDIDHFKRFNDTFGHEAGDFVLQSVADLLQKFFRGDDVPCRCGGEEFAVILPESLAHHAAARANSLRAEVKKLGLQHRGVGLAAVTISVGVATFPEHGSNSEDLLRLADQSLYKSKAAGRDRVTVAEQSVDVGPSEETFAQSTSKIPSPYRKRAGSLHS
jgi:diguanylate cyclase (GGDEF)-like protein/PAS domain S-box-containing protein